MWWFVFREHASIEGEAEAWSLAPRGSHFEYELLVIMSICVSGGSRLVRGLEGGKGLVAQVIQTGARWVVMLRDSTSLFVSWLWIYSKFTVVAIWNGQALVRNVIVVRLLQVQCARQPNYLPNVMQIAESYVKAAKCHAKSAKSHATSDKYQSIYGIILFPPSCNFSRSPISCLVFFFLCAWQPSWINY